MWVPKNFQQIISLVTCVTFFNNLIPKHDLLCCSEYDRISYMENLRAGKPATPPGISKVARQLPSYVLLFLKYCHIMTSVAGTCCHKQVRSHAHCTIAHSNIRLTEVTKITKTLQSLSSLSVALPQARSDNVTKLGSSI